MMEILKKLKFGPQILLCGAVGLCLLLFLDASPAADTRAAQLARILSQIEGAGRVEVYISYAPEESAYAFAESQQTGQILGAVVVASGADNAAVELRLAQAAASALGLRAGQVSVYKMGGGAK